MHISPPPPPPLTREDYLSHELLIASLAIQRAALLTKRVLRTLDNLPTPPSPTCSTPINGHPFFPSSFTSSSLHPSNSYNPGRRLSIAKSDASPVTIADFAAQALLISAIHSHFPDDSFIGEEDSAPLRSDPDLCAQVWELVRETRLEDEQAESFLGRRPETVEEMLEVIDLGCCSSPPTQRRKTRLWSMDPIDGTSAFLKGEQYAVSLALIDEHGKELLGLLACPNLPLRAAMNAGQRIEEDAVDKEGMGVMLSAVRGNGYALLRPMGKGRLQSVVRRINRRRSKQQVMPVRMEDLHFVDSSVSCATDSSKVEMLAEKAGARETERTEIYSSHMRYAAMVLGGREFAQVRFPRKAKGEATPWCLWDHAGSQLIYSESGAGKVTDLEGRPIDFGAGRKLSNNWGLITADESVHGEILKLAGEVLSDIQKA